MPHDYWIRETRKGSWCGPNEGKIMDVSVSSNRSVDRVSVCFDGGDKEIFVVTGSYPNARLEGVTKLLQVDMTYREARILLNLLRVLDIKCSDCGSINTTVEEHPELGENWLMCPDCGTIESIKREDPRCDAAIYARRV